MTLEPQFYEFSGIGMEQRARPKEAPSRWEGVNEWKRKQKTYRCLDCPMEFRNRGSYQQAQQHANDYKHAIIQGTGKRVEGL